MRRTIALFLIGGIILAFYRCNVITQEMGQQKSLIDKVKEAVQEAEATAAEESIVQKHNEIYEKVGENRWRNGLKGDTAFALMMELLRGTGSVMPTDEEVSEFVKKNRKKIRNVLEESAQPYLKEE